MRIPHPRPRSLACCLLFPPLLACATARPVRLEQVVLYQNGVGYFERAGHAEGDITLRVRRHEIDDVLTTMTVVDEAEDENDGPTDDDAVPSAVVPRTDGDGGDDSAQDLTISLGSGPRDVRLTYATQTAAWRASYRLVLADGPERESDTERDAEGGARPPRALLQGWAVVDNTTAEDWEEIQLVLATTAPLSFAVDLRTPRIVERPNVGGFHAPAIAFGPVRAESTNGERDGDGIADATDLCPDEAEDFDGFEDTDGCPDVDNDHDGILDVDDMCPADGESFNGTSDDDGCPDSGRVVIQDTGLVIMDKVYFAEESAEIEARSMPILDAVAATLQGNPTLTRIEIRGHADPHEHDPWRLSAERAAAVRAALIEAGVAGSRLVAVPFGATQPIDDSDTEAARERNRRVEQQIVRRAGDAVTESSSSSSSAGAAAALDTDSLARTLRGAPAPTQGAAGSRYVVRRRVSVPAGRSAMIAMVSQRLVGEDILLYRRDPNVPNSGTHPFRAARIVNGAIDLVPGPISLFSRGELLGQGLLGALTTGERAFVPYALDETTHVEREMEEDEVPSRLLGITEHGISVERVAIRTTRYRVTPGARPPRRLFVTHARATGYEPVGLPPETESSPRSLLLPMPVTPRRESLLVVEERRPVTTTIALTSDFEISLADYAPSSELAAGARDRITRLVADREALVDLHLRTTRLRERLSETAMRTAELRRSVASLGQTADASPTRRRIARTLEQAIAASEALASELSVARVEQVEAEARLLEAARGRGEGAEEQDAP